MKTKKLLSLENKGKLGLFIKEIVETMGYSTLVEMIDFCLVDYLKKICKDKNITFEKITFKMNPPGKTELMKYKEKLKALKKNQIDRFVEKFRWVGTHCFEGKPLTREKVLKEMKNSKSDEKQEEIYSIPGRFEKIIKIGSELTFQRSNLMETMDRVAYSYWSETKNLGKKHGLSFFDVVSMTYNEIIEFIKNGTIPRDLKNRKKRFGVVSINGKTEIVLGDNLNKELSIHENNIKILQKLKGQVAFSGKVEGIVKIIEDVKEIKKIKEGDIIIANETTSDFIIAIKKARAIVTNHGGITSHAAIIARELKIPCIIDTKIATKVLKDGDYVEVDANRGVVKKLNYKFKK